MKILKIIAFANLFTIMTGCDPSYSVFLANQSNKNIYVIHHVSDYPDTSIVDYYPSIESYVGSQDTSIVFYSVGSGFFIERDTVSLFVIAILR